MKYSLALLATASVVFASPLNNKRQGVTGSIAPSASAPSGCLPSYSGTFGIAVMNLTSSAGSPAVTTLPDGQPGASTGKAPPVSTISDGQPQASTGVAPVSTISDGQPQAPTSIAPVSTISDGQPQAPTMTLAPVSQISDGQIQATTMTMAPINQIGDGQIQNQKSVAPVSQISDGQPQAPTKTVAPVSTISDGQPQAPTKSVAPVSTISDGQPQAPTKSVAPVSTISDGQPQAPTKSAPPVSQISDGQIQATTHGSTVPVSTIGDGQPQATASASSGAKADSKASTAMSYVACKSDSTLEVTLAGGILTDNKGRTGYIASNYQFQFDGPPQAGAIYTAGWSVCGNSSLALGGSAVFYQCLSGNFYNLYDRNWAAQCSPITIQTVALQDC